MKGIFRFEQDDTDHDCCVKVVYKNDIKNLQNLQKEKKILKYLRRRDSSKPESHEYIVNCLCRSEEGEYFTPDNNMYFLTSHGDYTTIPISSPLLSIESILILEYGRCTLSELIISNDRLLLLTQRVHILQEIVQSIQFIHKMGVVHFDIKPENIMCFVYHGKIRWKLIDFNGSFILDENPQITREDMTLTSTSSSSTSTSLSLRYTKKYTAPEILEFLTNNSCVESIPIDESMDIWSLGILSFYLLTGNHFKESYSTLLTATTSTTATIPSDSNYFSSGDHSLDLYQDLIDQTIQYLPKKESSFLQSCLQINSKKRFNASQLLSKSLFKTNDSSQQGPSPGDLSYFLEKLGDMHDRLTCASTEKLVGILTEEFTQKFKDLYFALAVHSYRDE